MRQGRRIQGKITNRVAASLLSVLLLFGTVAGMPKVDVAAAQSSDITLTLATAKKLAVANSDKIESLDLSIEAKQAARQSALKSLTEKQRSMSSFRWSPLLSFKLPTKPNEQEAFEFQYKPIQLQNEIDTLKHQLDDQKIAEYEKVSDYFVTICSCEEQMEYYEGRRKALEKVIDKMEVRVKLGTSTQADVDKAKSELKQVETKLSTATTKYESTKGKLGKAIGIDVSTGYQFENPFVNSEMGRAAVPYLEKYTIARDQTMYEANCDEALALLSLRTNYSLMQNFYGSKINRITPYVTQAINGQAISKKTFKKDYDTFLKDVDSPWQGSYKIWFVRFPKEWLKGSIDGIRYVEDDPYVLYQNALDYQSAKKDRDNTEAEVIGNVDDYFENTVACRKAYLSAVEDLKKAQAELEVGDKQYILGKIDDSEYKDLQNNVNSAITTEESALTEYSQAMYDYDRLTCGGVSAYFESQSIDMVSQDRMIGLGNLNGDGSAESQLSTLVPLYEEGITYSIEYLADEKMFELRIDVPEDFEVENINYYELWCDDELIGSRTAIDQPLRHVFLATSEITKSEIRFYSSATDGYINSCEFDSTVARGNLDFIKGYNTFTEKGLVVGTYTVKNSTEKGKLAISIELNDTYGASMFAVKAGNKYKDNESSMTDTPGGTVYLQEDRRGQYSDLTDEYEYLEAVSGDLEQLTIEFCDSSGNILFEGLFGTEDQTIVVPREQMEYINQYQGG